MEKKMSSYQKLKERIKELELKYINDVELLVNGTEEEQFMFKMIYNKKQQVQKDLNRHICIGTPEPSTIEKMQLIFNGWTK